MIDIIETIKKDPTYTTLGKTETGEDYSLNLSSGLHWLVGGTTGSGKSFYIRNALIKMMINTNPDKLALIIVDPKKVEFDSFRDSPFMLVNPITNVKDSYGILTYLNWEMNNRYEVLEKVDVNNIASYNEWALEHPNEAKEFGYYPQMKNIIFLADDYAEIVINEGNSRDSEVLLSSIASKAKASGIILVLSTQRPSVEVFSSLLKANIPSRIGLKVASEMNSNIIIGESGLERLRGKGDSIVRNNYDGSKTRVQGEFMDDEDVNTDLKIIKESYKPTEKIDYKQFVVDKGLAKWEKNYSSNTPYNERHVIK